MDTCNRDVGGPWAAGTSSPDTPARRGVIISAHPVDNPIRSRKLSRCGPTPYWTKITIVSAVKIRIDFPFHAEVPVVWWARALLPPRSPLTPCLSLYAGELNVVVGAAIACERVSETRRGLILECKNIHDAAERVNRGGRFETRLRQSHPPARSVKQVYGMARNHEWNGGFSFSEDVELPVFERPGTGAVAGTLLLMAASSMRRFVCMCIERAY